MNQPCLGPQTRQVPTGERQCCGRGDGARANAPEWSKEQYCVAQGDAADSSLDEASMTGHLEQSSQSQTNGECVTARKGEERHWTYSFNHCSRVRPLEECAPCGPPGCIQWQEHPRTGLHQGFKRQGCSS